MIFSVYDLLFMLVFPGVTKPNEDGKIVRKHCVLNMKPSQVAPIVWALKDVF